MSINKLPDILIAEDDPLNQIIYQNQLSHDYEVRIANNGKECLTLLEEKKPDLLILDINMPDMHGYTVCEIIRKDPQYNGLPIIFVSALASEKEQQTGFDIGGNEFLTKPYEEKHLLDILKKYC